MDLKQIYRKETNLEPYEDIEVMNNFTLSYVKWLEAKINNTRSCEFLKASFKKGDVVLIDGWQERIVVQEFENGCVELESKNGCTLIGKGRLTLAPKSL